MEKFIQNVKEIIGLQLSHNQINAFQVLELELMTWNEQINLTAIRDVEGIHTKHFLDSLSILLVLNNRAIPSSIIDVGTGAGFPGLPLKIVLPRTRLTLVESVHKKAYFCEHMVEKLGLRDVQVLSERAEDVGRTTGQRQSYDLAVARAVAPMAVLVEYLLPLVKLGGVVVMQKGESAHAEAQASAKAIEILGGRLKQIIPVLLPGVVEERFLVVLDKVAMTSQEYPRKAGTPSKHPLE
jgi:16S rRNA (guanine527-N7)-methyltransferase